MRVVPSVGVVMGALAVLRHRNVGLVWAGSVISSVGTGAVFVALPVQVYADSRSVTATALLTLAEYLPAVGVAQLAGVWVDRVDARRVLVATNAALAVSTLGFLLDDAWWWLAVVALVRSCLAQLVTPAVQVLVPAVAPSARLVQVNALNAIGYQVARLAGPALGGVLVGAHGLGLVAVVDSTTFLVAAVLVAAVNLPRSVHNGLPRLGLLPAWLEGWEYVRVHPVLSRLLLVMMISGFGEGYVSALLVPWMSDVVAGTSEQLGLMLSLQAVGGIVGGVLVLHYGARWAPFALLGVGAASSAVLLVVIYNYPLVASVGPWPAVLLTGLAGVPFAVYGSAQSIALQHGSDDGIRGRAASLTFGLQAAAQLVGISLAAPTATLLGPLAINVDALAYLAAGLLATTTSFRGRRQRHRPTAPC